MFHVLVFRSVIIGLYKTTSHLTYLDNVLNESKTLCLLDFIFPWMDSTLTFVRSLQWQLFAVIALGRFRPHCVNTFTAKFSQKQISTKFPTPSSTLAVKGLIREQWPLSGVTPDRDGGGVNLRPQPSLHLPTIKNPTRPLMIVCYTAVFSVVTQRSSPQEERCVTTLKTDDAWKKYPNIIKHWDISLTSSFDIWPNVT